MFFRRLRRRPESRPANAALVRKYYPKALGRQMPMAAVLVWRVHRLMAVQTLFKPRNIPMAAKWQIGFTSRMPARRRRPYFWPRHLRTRLLEGVFACGSRIPLLYPRVTLLAYHVHARSA